MPSKLGETLQKARTDAGLSLRDVQRQTSIHNAHLSQIEHGHIERPEVGLLYQLAELYTLDLGELLAQSGHFAPGEAGGPAQQRAVASAALRAVGQLTPARQVDALSYLQRLSRPTKPAAPALSEEARRRVAAVAERALQWAAVIDKTPTPLEDVGRVAGIEHVRDAIDIPEYIVSRKPSVWKRILGAAVFPEKTIYVDRQHQIAPRANFTQAHEVAHMLLPWHEDVFRIDDERQLFYATHDELELEANYAAAHLIFQGHRYHERALQDQLSIRTPIDLANHYGASLHASIRFYVERHPDPVAVLVAGRYTQHDGTLPVWTSFESESFVGRYGRFADHLPGRGLPVDDDGTPLGAIAAQVREAAGIVEEKVTLIDLNGDDARFKAEGFFNQYSVFILVSPHKRVNLGRRTRLVASPSDG